MSEPRRLTMPFATDAAGYGRLGERCKTALAPRGEDCVAAEGSHSQSPEMANNQPRQAEAPEHPRAKTLP
jgi:hypothetical protein